MNQTPASATVGGATQTAKTFIVVGAALGLTCGFGPLFFSVVGVLLKQMAATFHWGRSDIATLPMLAMLGTAIGAPLAGYLADRKGWKPVIGWSILLFALVLLSLAVMPASLAYLMCAGLVIGLTGAATTAAGYLAVLPRVFEARLGMALGLGMVGTGLGGFVMPILAGHLVDTVGWRDTYLINAGLALVLGLIAHRLIFANMPAQAQSARAVARNSADAEDGLTMREALGSYRFWLLAVVMFGISTAILGGVVHMAPLVSDKGLGSAVAAQAVAFVGLGLAVARVGLGFMLDKLFAPLVSLVAFLVGATGFALVVLFPLDSSLRVLLASFLLGMSTGAEGDLIPYLTRRYFGKRTFGLIYGCLFGAATVGGAVGPLIYGTAFDRLKTYMPIHEISAIICVVGGLAMLLMGRYPARFAQQPQQRR